MRTLPGGSPSQELERRLHHDLEVAPRGTRRLRTAALALALALAAGCAGGSSSPPVPRRTPAQQLYWEGQLAVRKKDYDGALKKFEAARALAEKNGNWEGLASSLHAIALLRTQKGQLREGLEAMLRVLSLDRQALRDAKRAKAAEAKLRVLEAKISNDLYDLARIYRRRGDTGNTLRRLREALSIDLRLGRERGAAITHNNIGRLLLALGRLEEAETHYRAALALFEKLKDDARAREVKHNLEFLAEVRRTKRRR